MEFDEVLVPAENLLGQENHGFEIIMSSKDNSPAHPIQTNSFLPSLRS